MTAPARTPAPQYYAYFDRTCWLDTAADGGLVGHVLDLRTGQFEVTSRKTALRVLFAAAGAEITPVTRTEFIDLTERARARYLRGDGPIFALYDAADALLKQCEAENRDPTAEERTTLAELREATFAMWAEEFARRDTGEPAGFEFHSVLL